MVIGQTDAVNATDRTRDYGELTRLSVLGAVQFTPWLFNAIGLIYLPGGMTSHRGEHSARLDANVFF